MTAYAAAPTDTLAAARDEYFRRNGFGDAGNYDDAWVDFKIGPLPIPFPNPPARRKAVRTHDLHHALTGYGTDFFGELEISAWEVGAGCADVGVAWLLGLSGLAAGAVSLPRRTFRAFVRGRRARSLYGTRYDAALLARRVGEVRATLGIADTVPDATVGDVAAFAAAFAAGLTVGNAMLVPLLPIAMLYNLFRFVSPRA